MQRLEIRGPDDAPEVFASDLDGERHLPALWLRERSQDPAHRDPVTGQRLFDPHQIPEDIRITEADWRGSVLWLAFSDGYAGEFAPAPLFDDLVPGNGCPRPEPWTADRAPVSGHSWPDLEDDAIRLAATDALLRHGFIIIDDVPAKSGMLLAVGAHFGIVRETNFGAFFDITSRPNSNDLAYRSVALGPHTDNPYRVPVPGIQLLHCLVNETCGGASTLVDSLAVCRAMRAEDPDGMRLLSEISVTFRFADEAADHVAVQPVVMTDHRGRVTGVNYSPRLDRAPLLPEPTSRRYQAARRRLGALFRDPRFELGIRLEPGQVMMFDNNRLLHGRTAFDPGEGHRRFQGCYIDRDGPESLYRMLSRRLGRPDQAGGCRTVPGIAVGGTRLAAE